MDDEDAEREIIEISRDLEDRYFEDRRKALGMVYRRIMPDQDDTELSETMDNFEMQSCPPTQLKGRGVGAIEGRQVFLNHPRS